MNNLVLKALLLPILCASIAYGSQNWYYLKLPFSAIPLFGFYDQPRTVNEAIEAGWTKLDNTADCKDSNGGK